MGELITKIREAVTAKDEALVRTLAGEFNDKYGKDYIVCVVGSAAENNLGIIPMEV